MILVSGSRAFESMIRVTAFVLLFAAIALWERFAPRRKQSLTRGVRWPGNLGVAILNSAALRVLMPITAVEFAALAASRRWGLLNHFAIPPLAAIVLAVVALDLGIYLQHVMFHAVPALWRIHRMHHADLDFDVTTGVRFHPFEILISMALKVGMIAALGAASIAVLIFEVLLNATSMFNHGNVTISSGVDRWLRWLIVTPDMHRVHHSISVAETNSNFGFNLSCWDWMLGTYRAQPAAGHTAMAIGIEQFRARRELRLDRMLAQPFRGGSGAYSITPRAS